MTLLGIVVLALAITGVPAPDHQHGSHHAIECHVCDGVRHLHTCSELMTCKHGEICYSDVFEHHGEKMYQKGCWKADDCPITPNAIIGKRDRSGRGRRAHNQPLCERCCATSGCNFNDECDTKPTTTAARPTTAASKAPSTTAATTTAATTTAATTTAATTAATKAASKAPPTTAPPTTAATTTAATKAASKAPPPTTTVPPQTTVPASTCRDHEEDGFICSTLDAYNFCSEMNSSSLSYVLAHTKCQKHCGFCSASGSSLSATTPLPVVVNTQAQTDPVVHCVDHEDEYFDCLSWSQRGNCQETSDTLHYISVQRCSKFCGFC